MVKFKVNDVELDLEWWKNAEMTVNGAEQAKRLARWKPVEGFSHREATFVSNYYSVKNPLIAAVYLSFARHFPLILSPDVIWNTILQGVSTHVSKDPEKHRHAFVSHADKETISIVDNSLRKGNPANDWGHLACRFTDQIATRLSGKAALQALNTRFTTTDEVARVAHAITFMDVVKSYFEYRVYTVCGIPSIELTGTKEDWSQLRSSLALLDELELTPWRTQLDKILTHFEDAFENRVEHEFWNNIFLLHGALGSGGITTITGWIGKFFLYVGGKRNPVALGDSELRLDPVDFGPGLCETPFTWQYFGTEYKMLLRGGLVGVVMDPVTHAVSPQLGWLVTDAADDPALKPEYEPRPFEDEAEDTGTGDYAGYTEANSSGAVTFTILQDPEL